MKKAGKKQVDEDSGWNRTGPDSCKQGPHGPVEECQGETARRSSALASPAMKPLCL